MSHPGLIPRRVRRSDRFAQCIQPLFLVRLDGHDRNAELPAQTLHINADALRRGHIDHVQRHDDRHAQLESLRRQIQIAFEVAGIDDGDDDIRPSFALLSAQNDIDSHHLIGTARRKTVGAGQIDQLERLAAAAHLPFFGFDGDAGIIADALAQTG